MARRTLVAMITLSFLGTIGLSSMPTPGASAAGVGTRALPPGFHSSSAVPWSQVGAGWLLAQWSPGKHAATKYVVLVSPAGARFLLFPTGGYRLAGWSGDGRRALLTYAGLNPAIGSRLEVVDVRTAKVSSTIQLPSTNSVIPEDEAFTRPQGLAIGVDLQVNRHQQLTRYGLDGTKQQTFPTSFTSLGRYTGSWISSPDGTTIVMGAGRGLALVDTSGNVLARLPITPREGYCQPQRWWTRSVVLARCGTPSRLFEFRVTGGEPHALTRKPVPPDSGDLSAWHVGRAAYVQVASACGYVYLAKLEGQAPVMVSVPRVPADHSVGVVGTTSTAIDATANVACQPGASLIRYTPSPSATSVLLGRPTTAGTVDAAFIYPPPLG